MATLVDEVIEKLNKEIKKIFQEIKRINTVSGKPLSDSSEFYGTFKYTTTGNNLTHPMTLGLLTKILWSLKPVKYVGVDFRLNKKGVKFQPDLVALSDLNLGDPLLFIDYESPNSSDFRILNKNVKAYNAYCNEVWGKAGKRPPYIIITTLPDTRPKNTPVKWQLRYTASVNKNYKGEEPKKLMGDNPLKFWYGEYGYVLKKEEIKRSNIFFVNISNNTATHIKRFPQRHPKLKVFTGVET